jgi:hypothetical protein
MWAARAELGIGKFTFVQGTRYESYNLLLPLFRGGYSILFK